MYSSGAITPSLAFSATVSTAALVTPSAVRFWVSRPTMRATALRAAGRSCFCSSLYTLRLSCTRPLAANAWAHQNICTASPASGCSAAASLHTSAVMRNVPTGKMAASTAPPQSSPCGVWGNCARRRFSSAVMALPISTTGCGSQAGSPKMASSTKPPKTAQQISMVTPLYTARF